MLKSSKAFNRLIDEKFKLHLKESEFKFNNRKQNLYKILSEIIRKIHFKVV